MERRRGRGEEKREERKRGREEERKRRGEEEENEEKRKRTRTRKRKIKRTRTRKRKRKMKRKRRRGKKKRGSIKKHRQQIRNPCHHTYIVLQTTTTTTTTTTTNDQQQTNNNSDHHSDKSIQSIRASRGKEGGYIHYNQYGHQGVDFASRQIQYSSFLWRTFTCRGGQGTINTLHTHTHIHTHTHTHIQLVDSSPSSPLCLTRDRICLSLLVVGSARCYVKIRWSVPRVQQGRENHTGDNRVGEVREHLKVMWSHVNGEKRTRTLSG